MHEPYAAEVLQVLQNARELIAEEKNWTQGAQARTANGEATALDDKQAVCFCATGALCRVSHRLAYSIQARAYEKLSSKVPSRMRTRVALFNDDPSTTHKDVLKLFDDAIQTCKNTMEATS